MDALIEIGLQVQFDNSLLKIKKTTESVNSNKIKSTDGWITPKGTFIPNKTHKHIEQAVGFIRRNCWITEFKNKNKERGYDAGEFLIIEKGFVAIVDDYVLYCSENVTLKQAEIAGFTREKGILKRLENESKPYQKPKINVIQQEKQNENHENPKMIN